MADGTSRTASRPPTPPAPCGVPDRSRPQTKEVCRMNDELRMPIRFQPSYTNRRSLVAAPFQVVLGQTCLRILLPFQSYSNLSEIWGPALVQAATLSSRFSASQV